MKYSIQNGVHMVEVPVSDFRILVVDARKKSAYGRNYCNAGFFAGFDEKNPKQYFTLPVCNLKADYAADAGKVWEKHYCEERGRFEGNKWSFDSYDFTFMNPFAKHTTSNLVVANDRAKILDLNHVTDVKSDYMIGGVPVMRGGKDVKFSTYVRGQGWDGSTLYGTHHIFVGIKSPEATTVYVMGWKSSTGNLISSGEAFAKFKSLGFYDVIKLDGGGSYHLNVNGKAVSSTGENRQIQNIIVFDPISTPVPAPVSSSSTQSSQSFGSVKYASQNPYTRPTRNLYKGCRGNDVKWLQWMLYKLGFGTGTIGSFVDGSFGPGTRTTVMNWQRKYKLVADGSFGPASRNLMLTL